MENGVKINQHSNYESSVNPYQLKIERMLHVFISNLLNDFNKINRMFESTVSLNYKKCFPTNV